MRKPVLSLLFTLSLFSLSCFKKDTGCGYQTDNTVAPVNEQQAVKEYLDSIGVTASVSTTGLYYQIVSYGSGTSPNVCSRITVTYTGELTNGYTFDQQTDALFTLGGLIPGWKQGLPLIEKGGEIKLYVPPSLGYGAVAQTENGVTVIPANSILIFDIDLIDVQ